MLDLLAKKCTTGEASLSLAEHYLAAHEWGLAKQALEEALSKGGLGDIDHALHLLKDVCQLMGVSLESVGRSITAYGRTEVPGRFGVGRPSCR